MNKHIITICNQKGGVGKTTTSLELAYLFGQEYKTLVIDMDAQRNLSMYSGADLTRPGIYEVLMAKNDLKDSIQTIESKNSSYDIMISNKNLANSAKEFGEPDDIYLLSDLIEYLDYDIILLDQAPARSPLHYMGYIAATDIIIVCECDLGSLEGTKEVAADILRFQKRNLCNGEILGILLTKYENTIMHKAGYERLKEIGEEEGIRIFDTKIRKAIAVSECKEDYKTINEYEKYNNAALDYRQLTKEIINLLQ